MNCSTCKAQLAAEARYCPRCGTPTPLAHTKELVSGNPRGQAPARKGPPTWRLSVAHSLEATKSYLLQSITRIGRDPENEISLVDTQVSRFHAVIEWTSEGYFIRDLGSKNGTQVNRKPLIDPHRLHVGDSIAIGSHRMIVLKDTITCRSCRQPVSAEDRFCIYCGISLTGTATRMKIAESDEPSEVPPQPEVLAADTGPRAAAPSEEPPPDPVQPEPAEDMEAIDALAYTLLHDRIEPESESRTTGQAEPTLVSAKRHAPPPPAPPPITPAQPGLIARMTANKWARGCLVALLLSICMVLSLVAVFYFLVFLGRLS